MKKTVNLVAAFLLAATMGNAAAPVVPNACSSTVTTACGNTYTYSSCNVKTTSNTVNGKTTSKVYVDGKLVVTETCQSSGGGNPPVPPVPPFDICHYFPAFCQ